MKQSHIERPKASIYSQWKGRIWKKDMTKKRADARHQLTQFPIDRVVVEQTIAQATMLCNPFSNHSSKILWKE